MPDDRRAVLEAIAFGDDRTIKPSERLRAIELLRELEPDRPYDYREELVNLDGRQLQEKLDALVAAAFVSAHDDERRIAWSETLKVIEGEVARRAHLARVELEAIPRAPVLTITRSGRTDC